MTEIWVIHLFTIPPMHESVRTILIGFSPSPDTKSHHLALHRLLVLVHYFRCLRYWSAIHVTDFFSVSANKVQVVAALTFNHENLCSFDKVFIWNKLLLDCYRDQRVSLFIWFDQQVMVI